MSTPINNSTATTTASSAHVKRAQRILLGSDGESVLTAKQLMTDVKVGFAFQLPMQPAFDYTDYKEGKLNARQYLTGIVSRSVGFSFWSVGCAVVAAACAPLGAPAFLVGVLGFAGGMLLNDLWDRTFGHAAMKVVPAHMSEAKAKPVADFVAKYFASWAVDGIYKPIKNFVLNHKVLTGVVLGALALVFRGAAKGVAGFIVQMILGSLGALGLEKALMLDKWLPKGDVDEKEAPAAASTKEQDALADKLTGAYSAAVKAAVAKGKSADDADKAARAGLVETLVKSGADKKEAQALVDQVADQVQTLNTLVDAYNTAIKRFSGAGADAKKADEAARKWMVETLCKNGATESDAKQMVDLAAEMAKKPAKAAA